MAEYLTEIAVLLVFAALFLFWWRTQELKVLAVKRARVLCEKSGVQFLDQSVAFSGVALAYDKHRLWQLQRRYDFEFSSVGDERYKGYITLQGRHVTKTYMEPYKLEPEYPDI